MPRNRDRTQQPPATRAYSRRGVLAGALGVGTAVLLGGDDLQKPPVPLRSAGEITVDVAIVGGGLGGAAAAHAVLARGRTCALLEASDWLGGQLTTAGVPLDENRWVESFGSSRSYAALRKQIRDWYRTSGALTAAGAAPAFLNPGGGRVSRLTHLPTVSAELLASSFAPHTAGGRLRLFFNTSVSAVTRSRDRIEAVQALLPSGQPYEIRASVFLDATPEGTLIRLSGSAFVTGSESQRDTQEPHADRTARPGNQQAGTYCFALEHHEGEDHTIAKPPGYERWAAYVPPLKPAWPGRLFDWRFCDPQTLKPVHEPLDPNVTDGNRVCWWNFRRVFDRATASRSATSDITIVNWPMNDYTAGNLVDDDPASEQRHRQAAREQSLSFLYWLQTEAPNPNHGRTWTHGFPGLSLSSASLGTPDGFAKRVYLREGRRILAIDRVSELDIGRDAVSVSRGSDPASAVRPAPVKRPVGIGEYRLDLHPTSGGDNYLDLDGIPFQIPLGVLVPRDISNLLAASLCVGTTHIANGAYRTHQVEWSVGEAAGLLAAFCATTRAQPQDVNASDSLYSRFRESLESYGVPLSWPEDVYAK